MPFREPDSRQDHTRHFRQVPQLAAPVQTLPRSATGSRTLQSYEQMLVEAVASFGQVFAIGEPGEMLPPLGAPRLYVDGDGWHEVVQELLSEAQLIVLRIGNTKGFLWEINYARMNCDPVKVVIFVPAFSRRHLLPCSLSRCQNHLNRWAPTPPFL